MNDLLQQYRQTLRSVRRAWERAEDGDRTLLAGMVRDLEWTCTYLRTGYPPAYSVGPYRREVPVDPALMERVLESADELVSVGLQEDEARYEALQEALAPLTPAERDVYVLAVGQMFSIGETARLLGVARGTVQNLLDRARQKLTERFVVHPVA